MEENKQKAFRAGVMVAVLLGVLTVVEYFIGALASSWWWALLFLGVWKAFYVVRDYMHLPRVFRGDEEVHS